MGRTSGLANRRLQPLGHPSAGCFLLLKRQTAVNQRRWRPPPYGARGHRAQAQEMPLTTAPPVRRLSSSTVVGNTQ